MMTYDKASTPTKFSLNTNAKPTIENMNSKSFGKSNGVRLSEMIRNERKHL
jgi:hypothetical protein